MNRQLGSTLGIAARVVLASTDAAAEPGRGFAIGWWMAGPLALLGGAAALGITPHHQPAGSSTSAGEPLRPIAR
jgi:hypothetical protein